MIELTLRIILIISHTLSTRKKAVVHRLNNKSSGKLFSKKNYKYCFILSRRNLSKTEKIMYFRRMR